jgi:hypothetical protein
LRAADALLNPPVCNGHTTTADALYPHRPGWLLRRLQPPSPGQDALTE